MSLVTGDAMCGTVPGVDGRNMKRMPGLSLFQWCDTGSTCQSDGGQITDIADAGTYATH